MPVLPGQTIRINMVEHAVRRENCHDEVIEASGVLANLAEPYPWRAILSGSLFMSAKDGSPIALAASTCRDWNRN